MFEGFPGLVFRVVELLGFQLCFGFQGSGLSLVGFFRAFRVYGTLNPKP